MEDSSTYSPCYWELGVEWGRVTIGGVVYIYHKWRKEWGEVYGTFAASLGRTSEVKLCESESNCAQCQETEARSHNIRLRLQCS